MNLNFITVAQKTIDGKPYVLQRANVTACKQFWIAWRHASKMDNTAALLGAAVPDNTITRKTLSLRTEIIDGEKFYFIYRMISADGDAKPFSLGYTLSDISGLLPYQPRAVAHLCDSISRNGAAADGSDTGIGKTYHALSVCRNMVFRPAVVCRKSGIAGWKAACAHFNISPLFIANWESVKTGKGKFVSRYQDSFTGRQCYRWQLPKDTMLIFDEAHMGCNDGTQNNAVWMGAKGYPVLSLSASFADRITRLRGLMHILGAMTGSQFDQWIYNRGLYVNQYDTMESLSDTEDMKAANKIIYPRYGYRISCEDNEVKKYFPEGIYHTHIVSIGKEKIEQQNRLYRDLLQKVTEYRERGLQAKVLVADLRYRQAAELLKVASLIELTSEYMDQGLSVCIFVNFRETMKYLSIGLDTKSLIFGNQEQYGLSRDTVVEYFQSNKSRIIISMASAGGQSLNLHDIHGGHRRVSLICPTYDPISLLQILGRTRRAKSKTVPIMKLVYAGGTIEERIAHVVNGKLANIAALNDGDLMEPDLFNLGIERKEKTLTGGDT